MQHCHYYLLFSCNNFSLPNSELHLKLLRERMSVQYIFAVIFTILVCSISCFSNLDHAVTNSYYDLQESHAKILTGNPRFLAQRKDKENPISRSKFGSVLNLVEGELMAAKGHKSARTPAKQNEINVDDFGAKGNGGDDTEAFIRAWKKACSSTSDLTIFHVTARKEYNLRPITFSGPCKSAIKMNIHGNITGSKNLLDYSKSTGFWLIFENIRDLTVRGGGSIDGNGQVWWPKHCKIDNTRPCEPGATALTFTNCSNLRVTHLNFINAQRMHLTVDDCINVEVSRININAPEDSPNTDGIHVSGSRNVRIKNCSIHTGDDCISIVTGSHQIEATRTRCGPGHGISIGSLGKDGATDTVSNIKVNKATITGAENGARIKSWQGGKGFAENIIFEDIEMQDVKNPIIIDQFYCDKNGECLQQQDAVKIRNVIFRNIRGVSATQKGITLNCSSTVPCEGIKLENIELTYQGSSSLASCSSAKVSQIGKMSPQCPS